MLRKKKKLNYTTVKSYRVISLLNYIGKVCKNVLADMLSECCEVNHVLHECQMGSRKQRISIHGVAPMVGRMKKAWAEGKLTDLLLMNVMSAFDHVSLNRLLQTMEGLVVDGDLIRWTESFMSEKGVGLVIDEH